MKITSSSCSLRKPQLWSTNIGASVQWRSSRHHSRLTPRSQSSQEAVSSTCTPWHEIQEQICVGRANEPDSCDLGLSPLWKVFILSDGSVTRHLQLLTGSKVQVECLSMTNIGQSLEDIPAAAHVIEGPRVQRQVLLRAGPENKPLVYACSWWNAEQAPEALLHNSQVDEFLRDKSQPIWVSLSQGHVELYRDIQMVYHGNHEKIEELLGCKGPFWGRQYLFWHKQRPLTCIYEVFSNELQSHLGPKAI